MIYTIKKNKNFSPLLYFSISWSIVFFAYCLYWSDLLPKMIPQVALFLFATISISFILFCFSSRISFTFKLDLYKEQKSLKKVFLFTFVLFFLESIFFKGFPLLNIIIGKFEYGEFGLPFIHVIYYAISSIYCAKSFLLFCLSKNKKFLWYTLLFLSPGILIITRSYILYNLIYILIIYLTVVFTKFSLKKKIKILFVLLLVCLGIIYLFGLIGDIRTNALYETGSSYINIIAKPSEKFENKNPIILWFYCYVTTPLGNLINSINNPIQTPLSEVNDLNAFFYHFMPDLLKKRLFVISKHENLVVPYFNVSTVYASAYVPLGYLGMLFSFIGTLIMIYCVYRLKRNDIYSFLSFIFLSAIVFFNMFTNMFNFMGLAPQFWFSIVLMFRNEFKHYVFRSNF